MLFRSQPFAMTVGIAELLEIAQHAQAPGLAADGQRELAGGITWQRCSRGGVTLGRVMTHEGSEASDWSVGRDARMKRLAAGKRTPPAAGGCEPMAAAWQRARRLSDAAGSQ